MAIDAVISAPANGDTNKQNLSGKSDKPQPDSRTSQAINKPGDGYLLHPGTEDRNASPTNKDKIPMGLGAEWYSCEHGDCSYQIGWRSWRAAAVRRTFWMIQCELAHAECRGAITRSASVLASDGDLRNVAELLRLAPRNLISPGE